MKKHFFLFCVLLIVLAKTATSQTLPPGFAAIPVTTGWDNPVGVTFTPDGLKMFVWERGGKVYVLDRDGSGNYIKQATPVLNITEEVGNYDAYGMLGFALDPNFASNGLIYVLYVMDRHYLMFFGTPQYNPNLDDFGKATIGRLTRYQTMTSGSNLVVNPASRTILIGETKSTGMPIVHLSHGTGTLAFAADGTLLVSIGDAANYDDIDAGNNDGGRSQQAVADGIMRPAENVGAFRSQMLNSMSGKLLRIDPTTGNGVPSNPFYDAATPRSGKSRVWALGLRNSCRFTIKPGTGSTDPSLGDIGEIYAGDVGWASWEDLNIIKAPGMNFGWPLFEGQEVCTEYMNLNTENQDEPNPLFGINGCTQQYLKFKDLIKQATADGNKTIYNPCNPAVPIGTGNRFVHARPALDWSHAHQWARRGIFNGNVAAVAMVGTPESGTVGTPFNGNCSLGGVFYTGDAYPAGYKNTYFQMDFGAQWIKRFTIDFTDVVTRVDNFATNCLDMVAMTQHPIDGTIYTVQMSSNGVKKITYGGNIPPIVNMTSDKTFGTGPLSVQFTGNTSTDPDGTIASYLWNFGDATTSTAANPSHSFTGTAGVPKKFVVKLTVTDNGGATAVDSIIISINNTPPVVNITSPIKNSTYTSGPDTIYSYTATVSDAEHTSGFLKYEWQTILRHNNHQHAEAIDTNKVTSARISRVGCFGNDSYYWLTTLKVTDAAGLSTMDSAKMYPACAGVFGTLNGSITLNGRPAPPNAQWAIPLVVDLYGNGNNTTPMYSYNVTTDQTGNFSITNVPVGTYTMTVKNTHTLKKVKLSQSITTTPLTVNFGTLLEGDSNNDNFVSAIDLGLLLSSYNKASGDPGYQANADMNHDGFVTAIDLGLLLPNYNSAGENP